MAKQATLQTLTSMGVTAPVQVTPVTPAPAPTNGVDMATVLARLNALEAENAALKAQQTASAKRTISLKISAKGALSVYGIGRFPVTLYAGQWETVFGIAEQMKTFIAQNAGKLSRK